MYEFTSEQNEQPQCRILKDFFQGTSLRQSLHSRGGSSGTCTKRPVLALREYLEPEASVNKLEHREHILDVEVGGDTLNRLNGCNGSMLPVDEDDDPNTPLRARTVSHFLTKKERRYYY